MPSLRRAESCAPSERAAAPSRLAERSTTASSAADCRLRSARGAPRHGWRRKPEVDAARDTPTRSSSATRRTSSTAARAPTGRCGARASGSTRASTAPGRSSERSSSPTSTATTSSTCPTSSWGAGRRTSSTCTGPVRPACRSRSFPPDADVPLVFPDEPAPGHSSGARPHAPGLRLQHQPPHRGRGTQGRDAVGGCARDRRVSRRLRPRHRSRRRGRLHESRIGGAAHGACRHLSRRTIAVCR